MQSFFLQSDQNMARNCNTFGGHHGNFKYTEMTQRCTLYPYNTLLPRGGSLVYGGGQTSVLSQCCRLLLVSLACIKPIPVLRIPTYCATDGKWDAPGDIVRTEARLELLSEHSRSKRCYTKKNKQYWESEGIRESRAKRLRLHTHTQTQSTPHPN